jgi:hypothetical protein
MATETPQKTDEFLSGLEAAEIVAQPEVADIGLDDLRTIIETVDVLNPESIVDEESLQKYFQHQYEIYSSEYPAVFSSGSEQAMDEIWQEVLHEYTEYKAGIGSMADSQNSIIASYEGLVDHFNAIYGTQWELKTIPEVQASIKEVNAIVAEQESNTKLWAAALVMTAFMRRVLQHGSSWQEGAEDDQNRASEKYVPTGGEGVMPTIDENLARYAGDKRLEAAYLGLRTTAEELSIDQATQEAIRNLRPDELGYIRRQNVDGQVRLPENQEVVKLHNVIESNLPLDEFFRAYANEYARLHQIRSRDPQLRQSQVGEAATATVPVENTAKAMQNFSRRSLDAGDGKKVPVSYEIAVRLGDTLPDQDVTQWMEQQQLRILEVAQALRQGKDDFTQLKREIEATLVGVRFEAQGNQKWVDGENSLRIELSQDGTDQVTVSIEPNRTNPEVSRYFKTDGQLTLRQVVESPNASPLNKVNEQ